MEKQEPDQGARRMEVSFVAPRLSGKLSWSITSVSCLSCPADSGRCDPSRGGCLRHCACHSGGRDREGLSLLLSNRVQSLKYILSCVFQARRNLGIAHAANCACWESCHPPPRTRLSWEILQDVIPGCRIHCNRVRCMRVVSSITLYGGPLVSLAGVGWSGAHSRVLSCMLFLSP